MLCKNKNLQLSISAENLQRDREIVTESKDQEQIDVF